jgi:ceramide glucosyltransferase
LHLFWLIFWPAVAYQILALFASFQHARKRATTVSDGQLNFQPGISVLKPLRGLDPNTHEAFVSQIQQDYPNFEILFGVSDSADLAAEEVRRLQREFPHSAIRLIVGSAAARNGKVGVLMELARHAQNPVWVVNDSDIKVDARYLREIVDPLGNSEIGIVTCPYRAQTHTVAAAWEALGIATDFMPSTLVAQLLGVREFGLGSTLAFRAADLERAGGFAAIAGYLADDYQLAKRITALGKRALLSTYIVETSLGDSTWTGVWRHQLRWARTIRASKGKAYAGLPIAQAGVWILIALATGAPVVALLLLLLRLGSAFLSAAFVLRSAVAARFFWLSPVWDLYSFAVWLVSYAGREVRWRDHKLLIDREGRIHPVINSDRVR